MLIGGFQKFSLIDYPEKISAVIFTQGCNFKCPYCHNPELVIKEKYNKAIPEDEIIEFLKKRRRQLEGVVITGGEPTLQKDLKNFIKKIKKFGYSIKLDTNGSQPKILKEIIPLIDYIALDIKAPLEKYSQITNTKIEPAKIKKSIELIKKSKIDYEFRTTLAKSQLKKNEMIKIGRLIKGTKLFVIQKFIPSKTINPEFLKKETPSPKELKEFQKIMTKYVKRCIIR